MPTSLLTFLDDHIFAGVSGNIAHDVLKASWSKVTQKNWEEIYLDSFQSAISTLREHIEKYSNDGDVSIDQVEEALHGDLHVAPELMSVAQLTDEDFARSVANALHQCRALTIGGHNLTENEYHDILLQVVKLAHIQFMRAVWKDEVLFREASLKESMLSQRSLSEIRQYLEKLVGDINNLETQQVEIKNLLGLGVSRTKSSQQDTNTLLSSYQIGQGICGDYLNEDSQELEHRYFLSAAATKLIDIRPFIEDALQQYGVKSIYSRDYISGIPNLCETIRLIRNTKFGIYYLDREQDRITYANLGLSIGLNRPFVLVRDSDSVLSALIGQWDSYPITDYLVMAYELKTLMQRYSANVRSVRLIHNERISKLTKTAVLVHGTLQAVASLVPLINELRTRGCKHLFILGNPDENLHKYIEGISFEFLDNMADLVSAIQVCQIVVHRVDHNADPNSFLAAGISIALSKSLIMVSHRSAGFPSAFDGLGVVEFNNFSDLSRLYKQKLDQILPNGF